MRLTYKAEIRLVDENDPKKSSVLKSTSLTSVFPSGDSTAKDLCDSAFAILSAEGMFDANTYTKVKEEVTKPARAGVLSESAKLQGSTFAEHNGFFFIYTLYVSKKPA